MMRGPGSGGPRGMKHAGRPGAKNPKKTFVRIVREVMSRYKFHYRLFIADIQLCHIGKEILKIPVLFCQQTHFIAQLSVGSRH